jgi:hypothetical protein
MKKLVLVSIIGMIAISGSVFADDDCDLVIGKNITGTIENYQTLGYQTVIPDEAFKMALTNLKAYCCTKARDCSTEKDKIKEKPYPPSAFLFDHLFDVTMRRLDGIQSLAYGLEVDPTGKARREYINKVASDPNGAQALELEKKYKEYRTLHTKDTKEITTVTKNFSKSDAATLATFSLGDRYNKVCELMKMMYEGLQKQPTII